MKRTVLLAGGLALFATIAARGGAFSGDDTAVGRELGYVRRTEKHGIAACDWQWILDFAER